MNNYLGEIRIFPYNWAPDGWHICDGSLLNLTQYMGLYSLIGTQYGGDGKTTFGIPDLRGATPLVAGFNATINAAAYQNGNSGGVETVTLLATQLPAHTHSFYAVNTNGNVAVGAGGMLGIPNAPAGVTVNMYTPNTSPLTTLNQGAISTAGSSAAHPNIQPFEVLNFCIATLGIYPPRD